ncbi:MAG: hypothetical protein ACHQNA_15035, partial [Acidimicrobiales bacterium]
RPRIAHGLAHGDGRPSARVTWPWGFYARFSPDLTIYSGDGHPVAHGGEVLDLGGGGEPFFACSIKGTIYAWP